ncbi:Penicillin acylase-like protein [Candidatus Terasakiella magnetica]|nr:Penicillin acylase-like protein [Candidatus Terasakiella magnetica]
MNTASPPDADTPPESDYGGFGREMSRSAMALNLLLLVLILLGSTLFVGIMGGLPQTSGVVGAEGIGRKVAILRDSVGVPRIEASSLHDSYFALGWVHAQDRLWQMEMQRRVGAGRLAEAVGEAGLSSDRFMRTLGLYAVAERTLPKLDEPTRRALNAYADGVNAWLTSNTYRLPLEFYVLGIRPEPWSPADSLVWQKLMALQLPGNWHDEVAQAQLARILPPKRLQELFPATAPDAPTTLGKNGGKALLDVLPEAARPQQASNVWALAGRRTASGKPLLANDPHLGFSAPIQWYLAEIVTPEQTVTGGTIPGLPFHVVGYNQQMAWGFTSTHADTVDLFIEKLAGDGAYKAPDGSRPFVVRDEVIRVKGGADVVLKVRETRHGPVISDLTAREVAGPGEVVALSATLLAEADLTVQALGKLNAAKDWASFLTAVKDHGAPVLNIAYADTMGNIGFVTAGRVPVRKSGNGALPAKGWTNEGDWTGWVPFTKMPQALNPSDGIIVNANNKVANTPMLTASWPEGYRAQRIRDLLTSDHKLGLPDMLALQGDAVSLQALELKELLTGIEFASPRARQTAHMIAEWNGEAARDRPEPLIFAAWMERLNRALLADELKEMFSFMEPPRPQVLMDILTHRRHWCDDVTTPEPESCETQIERSLEQALADLAVTWGPDMSMWRWGAAHHARFDNPVLGKVPLLRDWANLDMATSGDSYTVSRGTYRSESNATRFPHVHGAGLRVVFDLADLSKSRFAIATGQSGHPLSRHYSDMTRDWSENRSTWPVDRSKHSLLVLEPKRMK